MCFAQSGHLSPSLFPAMVQAHFKCCPYLEFFYSFLYEVMRYEVWHVLESNDAQRSTGRPVLNKIDVEIE